MRAIKDIAKEIRSDWKKPYFGAVPYLDSAKSIVLYFLANANTWRGETARRIKAELKSMCK